MPNLTVSDLRPFISARDFVLCKRPPNDIGNVLRRSVESKVGSDQALKVLRTN